MTKLIKVIQVKDGTGAMARCDIYATFRQTTTAIFGTKLPELPSIYEGVTIKPNHSNAWGWGLNSQLTAILLSVEDHPNSVRRAVKIDKEGFIDASAVLAKFNELKVIANEVKARRQKSQEHIDQAEALLERVKQSVNYPKKDLMNFFAEDDYPARLSSRTPETVHLILRVSGVQLVEIEKVVGAVSVELTLNLNEADAIAVYNITKPTVK